MAPRAASRARGVGRTVGVGLPRSASLQRSRPPRARLRVGLRRDRGRGRGPRPRAARRPTRTTGRGQCAGGRARRPDPVVGGDGGLPLGEPAAPGGGTAQRRRRVLGAARFGRLGARGRRFPEAVGRLQDAHAQPRRLRSRRVAQPAVPSRQRRRDPDAGARSPHRPHQGRPVRRSPRTRCDGGRAPPAARVRRAPADPRAWLLRRHRHRRRRGAPVRDAAREAGTHADIRPPCCVAGRRRDVHLGAIAARSPRPRAQAAVGRRAGHRVRGRRGGARDVRRAVGAGRRRDQDRVAGQPRRLADGQRQDRADRQELHLQRRVPGTAQRRPRPQQRTRPRGRARAVRVRRRGRREPARRRARAARARVRRRARRQSPSRLRVVAGLRARRPVRRDARVRAAQLRFQRRAPALEPPRRALSVWYVDEPPRSHRRPPPRRRRPRRPRRAGSVGRGSAPRARPDRGGGVPRGRGLPRGGAAPGSTPLPSGTLTRTRHPTGSTRRRAPTSGSRSR